MSQDSFDRFDAMAEQTIYPWVDDNYDDHDDFYGDVTADDIDDLGDMMDDDFDDSMDGDHDSAMDSIGWGDDDSLAYGGGEDY